MYDFCQEYSIIKIKGIKKKDSELVDNLFNSRKFGEFVINIPLKADEFLLSNETPNIQSKMGIFIIEFSIKRKKDPKKNMDSDDEFDI